MKFLDDVEVLVDKKEYQDNGIYKGMIGILMSGYWTLFQNTMRTGGAKLRMGILSISKAKEKTKYHMIMIHKTKKHT